MKLLSIAALALVAAGLMVQQTQAATLASFAVEARLTVDLVSATHLRDGTSALDQIVGSCWQDCGDYASYFEGSEASAMGGITRGVTALRSPLHAVYSHSISGTLSDPHTHVRGHQAGWITPSLYYDNPCHWSETCDPDDAVAVTVRYSLLVSTETLLMNHALGNSVSAGAEMMLGLERLEAGWDGTGMPNGGYDHRQLLSGSSDAQSERHFQEMTGTYTMLLKPGEGLGYDLYIVGMGISVQIPNQVTPVPVPPAMALLPVGLLALAGLSARRRGRKGVTAG